MELKDILHQVKPLDLFFFKSDGLYAKAIKMVEFLKTNHQDTWTHVGLVVNRHVIPNLKVNDDNLYLWESSVSGNYKDEVSQILDAESHQGILGVQVRPLEQVVDGYLNEKCQVGWSRLIFNPIIKSEFESQEHYNKRFTELQNKLNHVHEKSIGSMYQINPFRLLGSFWSWFSGKDNSMYFCSNFVTYVYEKIGILPKQIDESKITPIQLAHLEFLPEYKQGILPKLLLDTIQVIVKKS